MLACNVVIVVENTPGVLVAIKRFKKKVEKAGVLDEYTRHLHYEKPSERRRRKLKETVRRLRKNK